MLVFELAACFFSVYDCFNVAQASKECYVRSNIMFRNYVHEIRKIVDRNWIDLFLHDKMEDYDYPKINQHLLNFLNNKPCSKKISWKTFALLLNMNLSLYPRQVKKNPILRAGSIVHLSFRTRLVCMFVKSRSIVLVFEAYRQALKVQRISLFLVEPKGFGIVGCQLANVEHLARKVNISIL